MIDDVADIALDSRGNVSVAAVKIETMHAAADRAPLCDQFRISRICNVVDIDAAADVAWRRFAEPLLIDDHNIANDPHLVRVPALAHWNSGEDTRRARIGDVEMVVPEVGRMWPT